VSRALRTLSSPAAVALLVYAALAVLLTSAAWTSPLTRFVGGGADSEQTMWFLSWPPFAVSHLHSPFVSTYINYPTGVNLLWNTSVLAPGFILSPVTAIWGPVATYNVVMTGSLVLSAWFGFFAIRRFVTSDIAAALGGLLYGFSPYVIAQLFGHTHLVVSTITPPLALMLADELLIRQRRRVVPLALMLAGLVVLQFFIAEEVLTTEVIFGAILGLVLAALHPSMVRFKLPFVLRTLGLAMAIAALVLAYPLYVQFLGPDRITGGAIHPPDVYLTDALNLIVPTEIQLIAPSAAVGVTHHFTGNPSEWNGYIGIPLLLLTAFTAIRWWRVPVVRAAAIMTLVVTLFSLGPHLHIDGHPLPIVLPWWIPAHLPVLDNILPSRLMLFAYLGLGVCLAFALTRMWTSRGNAVLSMALIAFVFVPLLPRIPFPAQTISVPGYFTSKMVDAIPDGSVVVTAPWSDVFSPDPMLWQVAAGNRFRNTSGYVLGPQSATAAGLEQTIGTIETSGTTPSLNAALRAELLAELRTNKVGAMIVGPSPHEAQMASFFADLLGPPSTSDGQVDVWLLG
jgi:hypothetical protein